MMRALWASASGMEAQQTNIDVIANNLANVNTAGFKRSSVQFEDLMYEIEKAPGASLGNGGAAPTGVQVGNGSRVVSTTRAFTQGHLQNTGRQLDVAIQGRGFFEVEMPDGSLAYTRDGAFHLNADGEFVTSKGYRLSGSPTVDPTATEISISPDGTLSAVVNGAVQELTPITLSDFANPAGLRSLGDNLYGESEASGTATTGQTPGQDGVGTLAQSFLEISNVSVVEEMVRMIHAQRAYEINSKSIQASDEMLRIANNLRR